MGQGEVREIQRRRPLPRPVRRRARRRGDPELDLPEGLLQERVQHHRAQRRGRQALSRPVHPQRLVRSRAARRRSNTSTT